ncbi:EF-hand domain-containing protein [Bradyrhizobium sp. CCGUVB23]|uniref:EF-hand domain-containing protein n=1 Tax=Bradyrhizobium sp. CCGUVB23 TaxID=2949630 RepID=UPI0020B3D5E3|nr:hypothetical protein [Bradyrhizobium sp. CCGUVB23]MCP3467243.1 hypothetical protein [Bradyrhizobium sp. CCGUVB23]
MICHVLNKLSLPVLPLLAIAMTLLTGGAFAQRAPAPAAPTQSPFGRAIRTGDTLAQYLDRCRAEFRKIDVNGDGGITEADLKLQYQLNEAAARAGTLPSLLQFDLEGDGVVTRAEVETFLAGSMITILMQQSGGDTAAAERQFQSAVTQAMAPDTNGDGRIDAAEMLAIGAKRAIHFDSNSPQTIALTLDENSDGRVTREEYLQAAEAAFRRLDSDADGVLSREEIEALRSQNIQAPKSAK